MCKVQFMKYDAIVIGSGLGGLECACILSRNGLRTLVLEKGKQPGGCMQSYMRKGLRYDTGFHYVGGLGEGQSLHPAFRYLGLLDLPWHRLDEHFDRVTVGGRTYPFVEGFDSFARTLASHFPGERHALERYAQLLSNVERTDPVKLLETGAYAYLKETFRNPLLTNVLGGTSLKMELRRESLPLFTFLHGNSSFIESSWRLKGDSSLIVRSLSDSIRRQGGEIICGAEVEELIEKEGKIVRAVCTDGNVCEGDIFISDVHPAVTCSWVKRSDKMKPVFRSRMARLENTFGMCTVSLRIKPGTLPYFNWNHYVYRKPNVWSFCAEDGPVGGVLVSCRVPEDGNGYTDQVDLLTPMRWEQCRKWEKTCVGNRGEDYRQMKERMADQCVALAEEVIPGLGGRVAERYISTPLTYRDYLAAPEGSAYGTRKDFRNPLLTMLSPRTPVPNLLLTGQSVMLHGLHGVTMTAFLTCAEILGKEEIKRILKD